MKICDICEKPSATDLILLRDPYQSEGIKEVCGACEKWANEEKTRITNRHAQELRDALIARKATPPTPRKRWWAFFSMASANAARCARSSQKCNQ
jgi:hypothetical protein